MNRLRQIGDSFEYEKVNVRSERNRQDQDISNPIDANEEDTSLLYEN